MCGSVCSGWGAVGPVYGPGVRATSVGGLRTAVYTASAVTRGADGVEVFWNFSRIEEGEWPVMELPVPNFMQYLTTRLDEPATVSAWSGGGSGW